MEKKTEITPNHVFLTNLNKIARAPQATPPPSVWNSWCYALPAKIENHFYHWLSLTYGSGKGKNYIPVVHCGEKKKKKKTYFLSQPIPEAVLSEHAHNLIKQIKVFFIPMIAIFDDTCHKTKYCI